MTVREALRRLVDRLTAAGLEETRLEASLLVAFVLGLDHRRLPLLQDHPVTPPEWDRLDSLGRRRESHEPLQYLLGEWPFLDLTLEVHPAALIPRPETEDWVDRLLRDLLPRHLGRDRVRWFADLGTGTGAIGLALARGLPTARGVLCDLSREALGLAARNLDRYPDLAGRLFLACGDLASILAGETVDLIAANPPYIDSGDLPGLMPEVRDHEPILALDGGTGGVVQIARLLADAGRVLRPGGLLILEHGHGQRPHLLTLPTPHLSFLEAGNDAAGLERFLVWRKS